MSTINVNQIVDASGGVLTPISSVMRNRIINGAMVIDQRNSGASISTSTTGTQVYSLDRWAYFVSQASKFTVQQDAGAVTPPAGFTDYLGCTSTAATSIGSGDYFQINQIIEGYNIADLNWGTANAKPITISFWVRSSLTGTFGGSLRNGGINRSYPFTYTISAANTWELETITIPGDTSGTWSTTNGFGLQVIFGLGMGSTFSGTAGAWASANFASATGATSVVGTNGATFYITGVQLEVGTQATSFEYRQYGTELALCQRYYQDFSGVNNSIFQSQYKSASGQVNVVILNNLVTMRTTPTVTIIGTWITSNMAQPVNQGASTTNHTIGANSTTSGVVSFYNTTTAYHTLSAEL